MKYWLVVQMGLGLSMIVATLAFGAAGRKTYRICMGAVVFIVGAVLFFGGPR